MLTHRSDLEAPRERIDALHKQVSGFKDAKTSLEAERKALQSQAAEKKEALARARVEATTAKLDRRSHLRTTKKESFKRREDLAETCNSMKDLRGRNRDIFDGR
jgi:regulator of replication initiation timing